MLAVVSEAHSTSFPQAEEGQKGNNKAACTNCRQSHVACSHEMPCSRCKTLGLDDSCRYLPRKRRTDFKKRKQEIEKKKKGPMIDDSSVLPAMAEENEGLLNATLTQLFGEEYPFPLLDSNQSPTMNNWIGTSEDAVDDDDEDTNETDWISKLSKAIGEKSSAPRSDVTEHSSWPFSFGLPEITQGDSYLPFSVESSHTTGLELTTAVPVQRNTEDRLIANRTSSKTLRLLHDLKQKNDRLEQLLRNALQDIKQLKEREIHYQQQMQNYMREEQRSFQLFSLGPARDFDHPGMIPGIAMFSLLPAKRHQILQCNQTFQVLVGRSWQELSQGFTCCQMFPKRILPLLQQRFSDICNKDGPAAAEGELIIARPNGEELAIKAYSHVIFDDAGEPLYKMFYAFALQ